MGKKYEYDIALSYASEDRDYVEQVANLLKNAGISVFFDRFEAARLLGKNLYEHFIVLFEKKARYCVVFTSKAYIDKDKRWTTHELRGAQARAFQEREEYILPARFDDSDVPGILTTTGYADLRTMSPSQFVDILLSKLREPGEPVKLASSNWHANGYDTNWLLPEADIPEDSIIHPAVQTDERLASFIIVNLIYYGRIMDALALVRAISYSRLVASILAHHAGHRMRRLKYRAAGYLHTMEYQVREEGIAYLQSRGSAPELLTAISTGDFRQAIEADKSLAPLMRATLLEELEIITRSYKPTDDASPEK